MQQEIVSHKHALKGVSLFELWKVCICCVLFRNNGEDESHIK